MQSILRRLVGLAAALSLLLGLAVVVMWLRSYRAGERVRWRMGAGGSWFVTVSGGAIMLLRVNGNAMLPQDGSIAWTHLPGYREPPTGGLPVGRRRVGFAWGAGILNNPTLRYRVAIIPLGAPAAAMIVLPIAWLESRRRRRRSGNRSRAGCCRACGYDLRATPDRCPECGAAVPTKREVTR